jgi:hypothetical protein
MLLCTLCFLGAAACSPTDLTWEAGGGIYIDCYERQAAESIERGYRKTPNKLGCTNFDSFMMRKKACF